MSASTTRQPLDSAGEHGNTNAGEALTKDPERSGGLLLASPEKTATSPTPKTWKWTKRKRRAVDLLVRGWSVRRIGEEIGASYVTVQRWKSSPEFVTAVLTRARDYVQRTRFKRVHETGLITDHLLAQIARCFARLNDGGLLTQAEVNRLAMLLREYRAFRSEERDDFGDDVRKVEGHFAFGITQPIRPSGERIGDMSFKQFFEANSDKIPTEVFERSKTVAEALVLATRELIKNTDIVDQLFDEENEAIRAESASM